MSRPVSTTAAVFRDKDRVALWPQHVARHVSMSPALARQVGAALIACADDVDKHLLPYSTFPIAELKG